MSETRKFIDALSKCCASDVIPMLSIIVRANDWEYDEKENILYVNLVFIHDSLMRLQDLTRATSFEFVDGDGDGYLEYRLAAIKLSSPFPSVLA